MKDSVTKGKGLVKMPRDQKGLRLDEAQRGWGVVGRMGKCEKTDPGPESQPLSSLLQRGSTAICRRALPRDDFLSLTPVSFQMFFECSFHLTWISYKQRRVLQWLSTHHQFASAVPGICKWEHPPLPNALGGCRLAHS